MKEKVIMFLIVLGMALFMVACSVNDQTSAFGDGPDSTAELTPEATLTPQATPAELTARAPEATLTPEASPVSANKGVKIRLQNVSDVDFEQIEVRFKGRSEQFGELAASKMSEERIFSEIYLSSYVKVVVDGQEYVQQSIADTFSGREYPITAGSYTYVLDFGTNHALADLVPNSEPGKSSVASVIDALEAAGVTVSHEPTIQHQNIFEKLFGQPVATRERLQVNLTHVEIYVFSDAATAKEASETIKVGGTSFVYTRDDGTTVEEFWDAIIAKGRKWWPHEHFLISHGDMEPVDEATVALISNALQTDPISSHSGVQIRLVNMSELDFDNVSVNFLGQEVDYGELVSGQQSSYQSAQEAYHYAGIVVEANGQTYKMVPIDYIGETPLAAGQYSYALDIIGERVQIAYFPDEEDKVMVDAKLIDQDWYWVSAQKADNSQLFPMVYEEHPSIRFTQDPDPNTQGLHFEGYASCNWMGGAYHVNQYEALVVDEIGITERECEASDSEAFFLDFLRGINYYSVEGDYLFLFSWAGEIMTFTRNEPASEPPYATDSHAAFAPIVQAIGSHARDVGVTRLSPSSDVQWQIDFFGETISVYVFDDAAAAGKAIKSTFNDQNPERLWQDERFLITYDGDYDLIDDVLNELFGKPLALENQPFEEEQQEQEQEQVQQQE